MEKTNITKHTKKNNLKKDGSNEKMINHTINIYCVSAYIVKMVLITFRKHNNDWLDIIGDTFADCLFNLENNCVLIQTEKQSNKYVELQIYESENIVTCLFDIFCFLCF